MYYSLSKYCYQIFSNRSSGEYYKINLSITRGLLKSLSRSQVTLHSARWKGNCYTLTNGGYGIDLKYSTPSLVHRKHILITKYNL